MLHSVRKYISICIYTNVVLQGLWFFGSPPTTSGDLRYAPRVFAALRQAATAQILKIAGCVWVAAESILVYAYILI